MWVRGNKDIDIEERLKIIVSSVLIVKAKLLLLTPIQRKKENTTTLSRDEYYESHKYPYTEESKVEYAMVVAQHSLYFVLYSYRLYNLPSPSSPLLPTSAYEILTT